MADDPDALPLNAPDESFPLHVWNAFGVPPQVLTDKIGGSVMIVVKEPPAPDGAAAHPSAPVTVLTAGVGRLPVDSGLPVELAVEVPGDQVGAAIIALRIVTNDVATRRRTPPMYSPWRNPHPFLHDTQISAIVATGSRWGSVLDEVRNEAGEVVGHVRTLRLLTDAEAELVRTQGWDALLERAGSLDALLDVTRRCVVPG